VSAAISATLTATTLIQNAWGNELAAPTAGSIAVWGEEWFGHGVSLRNARYHRRRTAVALNDRAPEPRSIGTQRSPKPLALLHLRQRGVGPQQFYAAQISCGWDERQSQGDDGRP
jgi:hypothetical protein